MSHHNLLATVHLPVTADGSLLKNSFGVVLAEVLGDSFMAAALAQLINLAEPAAAQLNVDYAESEARKAQLAFGKLDRTS